MKTSHCFTGSPFRNRPVFWIVIVSVFGLVVGCRSIPSNRAAALHTASTELVTSTGELLDRIESTALETQIQNAMSSDQPLLTPDLFEHAIDPKAATALTQQLSAIEDYFDTLRAIASGEYQGKLKDPAVNLAKAFTAASSSLNDLGKFANAEELQRIQSSAGTLTAVAATIGELIIDASTQSRARKVIERTQQPLDDYLSALANLFSKTDDAKTASSKGPSLAAVLENEFQSRMGSLNKRWYSLGSSPSGILEREKWLERREAVARAYVAALRGKELSPTIAVGLRKACLSIAKAHHALLKDDGKLDLSDLEQAVARVKFLNSVFKDVRAGAQ
jgi:DnaJ-domain-containing protein 1